MSEKLAYHVDDAARKLGIGERLTWKLVETGELASFKVGRRRLISDRALREYVHRKEQEAST